MRPERSDVVQSIAANVEEDAMKRILLMLVTILSTNSSYFSCPPSDKPDEKLKIIVG